MLGDLTMSIGKIDYSQPKLGFEGVLELERCDMFEPLSMYTGQLLFHIRNLQKVVQKTGQRVKVYRACIM